MQWKSYLLVSSRLDIVGNSILTPEVSQTLRFHKIVFKGYQEHTHFYNIFQTNEITGNWISYCINYENITRKLSHRRRSVKQVFVKISQNSWQNTFVRVSFLISQACNFIKKRLWYRCFPINLAKFLRTPFYIEHFRWLFLSNKQAIISWFVTQISRKVISECFQFDMQKWQRWALFSYNCKNKR